MNKRNNNNFILNKEQLEFTVKTLMEALISLNNTSIPSNDNTVEMIKDRLKFFGFYDENERELEGSINGK